MLEIASPTAVSRPVATTSNVVATGRHLAAAGTKAAQVARPRPAVEPATPPALAAPRRKVKKDMRREAFSIFSDWGERYL